MTYRSDFSDAKVPMVDIVQRYGLDVGQRGTMLCPFHHEKTPSMHIKGTSFYCFGCGAMGDAVDFVAKYEGLSVTDALRKVMRMYGITGSETTRDELERMKRERMEQKARKKALLVRALRASNAMITVLRNRDAHLELFYVALKRRERLQYLIETFDEGWQDNAAEIIDICKEVEDAATA